MVPFDATPAFKAAYEWLCRSRRKSSPRNPVWCLRRVWSPGKQDLLASRVTSGRYRLSPVERVRTREGDWLEVWDARDALVLKVIALWLTPIFAGVLSRRCFHLPGRGGAKGAVRSVRDAVQTGRYRFRPHSIELAPVAVDRMAKLSSLLYEHGASPARAGSYLTRWISWANGGISTGGNLVVTVSCAAAGAPTPTPA